MRNKVNRYICEKCGGVIVTIDLDEGTTPMFLECRTKQGCGGRMASSMYLCDQTLQPTHEWYKPTGKVKKAYREYVQMGGLLIRPVLTVR